MPDDVRTWPWGRLSSLIPANEEGRKSPIPQAGPKTPGPKTPFCALPVIRAKSVLGMGIPYEGADPTTSTSSYTASRAAFLGGVAGLQESAQLVCKRLLPPIYDAVITER